MTAVSGALVARPGAGPLAARLAGGPAAPLRLCWLGQAGFVLDAAGRRLVIDPYLSDGLAEKYRGGPFPHQRMMPAPVTPAGLGAVDLVLVTHHHTDHMDPQTLAPLLAASPAASLVCPAASAAEAMRRAGVGAERLIVLDAGERVEPLPGIAVTATRAAHETLERDDAGRHRFLGYLIEAAGLRLWHSGDCVPFDGLVAEVAPLAPDVVLLPVNGRRPELAAHGIAGNFSLAEAVDVAHAVGATTLVAHHHGLFAFNTADPAAIDALAGAQAADGATPRILRAATGVDYLAETAAGPADEAAEGRR